MDARAPLPLTARDVARHRGWLDEIGPVPTNVYWRRFCDRGFILRGVLRDRGVPQEQRTMAGYVHDERSWAGGGDRAAEVKPERDA